MSVSKRLRFDIFKRDSFTCGYCGSKPPNVILEVDHILASANGGTDEACNLITSCFDCNRGKSDRELLVRPKPLELNVGNERDRLAQIESYQKFLQEKSRLTNLWFQSVSDVWCELEGKDPKEVRIAGERELAVRRFLKEMPAEEIIEALYVTYNNPRIPDYSRLKYFCGCCWRSIRRARGEEI